MRLAWSLLFLLRVSSIANERTCRTKAWTVDDVDQHFKTSSDLFFLFGVQIHRPFVNEDEQTHADASVFIIGICKSGSSDCIDRRGSLPSNYHLKFTIAGLSFNESHRAIDRRWHRTKKINDDFLYGPFNSPSWYDDPDGSIWSRYIMNSKASFRRNSQKLPVRCLVNSFGNESLYTKWVNDLMDVSGWCICGELSSWVGRIRYPTTRCWYAVHWREADL